MGKLQKGGKGSTEDKPTTRQHKAHEGKRNPFTDPYSVEEANQMIKEMLGTSNNVVPSVSTSDTIPVLSPTAGNYSPSNPTFVLSPTAGNYSPSNPIVELSPTAGNYSPSNPIVELSPTAGNYSPSDPVRKNRYGHDLGFTAEDVNYADATIPHLEDTEPEPVVPRHSYLRVDDPNSVVYDTMSQHFTDAADTTAKGNADGEVLFKSMNQEERKQYAEELYDKEGTYTPEEEGFIKQYIKHYYWDSFGGLDGNGGDNLFADWAKKSGDKEHYFNMQKLMTKGTDFGGWGSGFVTAIPGIKSLLKWQDEKFGDSNPMLYGNTYDTFMAGKEQSPIAAGIGTTTSKILQYMALNGILSEIPAVSNFITSTGSKIASPLQTTADEYVLNGAGGTAAKWLSQGGAQKIGEGVAGVGIDLIPDIALDTIPETVDNIQSGMSAGDVAKETVKNIGLNTAFNIGGAAIPILADGAKYAGSSEKAVTESTSDWAKGLNIDEAKATTESVTDNVIKNADEVIPEKTIAEAIADGTATNKQIEAVLKDDALKKQIADELGIDLNGKTQAQIRKEFKDYAKNHALPTDEVLEATAKETVDDAIPETVEDVVKETEEIPSVKPKSEVPEPETTVDDEIDTYIKKRQELIDSIKSKTLTTEEAVQTARSISAMDEYMYQKHPELFSDGNFIGKQSVEDVSKNVEDVVSPTTPKLDNATSDAVVKNTTDEIPSVKPTEIPEAKVEEIPSVRNVTDIPETKPQTTTAKSTIDSSAENAIESSQNIAEKAMKDTGITYESAVTESASRPTHTSKPLGDGTTKQSEVYTNSFTKNRVANMKNRLDQIDSMYEVHNKEAVLGEGLNRLETNYDGWDSYFRSPGAVIEGDADTSTVFQLILDKQSQIDELIKNGGSQEEIAKLAAEKRLLQKKLRGVGTDAAEIVRSFGYFNGTPEGAIINTQRLMDSEAKAWVKANGGKAEEVKNLAEKLTESGTTTTKSGIKSADVDTEAKKVADKIMGEDTPSVKRSKKTSAKDKVDTSKRLDEAIKGMGEEPEAVAKKTVSHDKLVERVKNSIDEAYKEGNPFTDDDVNAFVSMIEGGASKQDLQYELSRRIKTYYEGPDIGKYYPQDSKFKNVLDNLENTKPEKYVAPERTLDDIKEQVRNTLKADGKDLADFTDADIDYISQMIQSGATKQDLTDMMNVRLATGHWDVPEETVSKVTELLNEANKLPINSKERVELETDAFWELANATLGKSSIGDKFDAWRYLAMLGNPKTHIRNMIGNTLFQGVTRTSDTIAAIMEGATDTVSKKVLGEGIERSKAVLGTNDIGLIRACKNDAYEGSYRQLASTRKYGENIKSDIKSQKEVFDTKFMRWLNRMNSDSLNGEDFLAMRQKYQTSLAGYLKSNKLDETVFDAEKQLADLKSASHMRLLSEEENALMTELNAKVDILKKGRDYAIKKAEYSAFHEDNAFADWLSKSVINNEKTPPVIRKILNGIVPYVKTPANIVKSGVEYSPLNLANDIKTAFAIGKGNATAKDFIDSYSKTLTGTSIMALGAYAYRKGVLLSSNEDTKWQDNLEGKQNYSLKIGNHTYTIDFAAPSVMPLLLGAEIAKMCDEYAPQVDENGIPILNDGSFWDRFTGGLQAVSRLASPILETSFMSGVNDTLQSLSSGEGDALGNLAMTALTGYATQGIPTLFGQAARSIDNTRRSTYSDEKTQIGKTYDKTLHKQINKIPFLSMTQDPYLDAYARTQSNSPANTGNKVLDGVLNTLYQFASPSYIQKVEETDVDTELRRLYGETNDADVFFDLNTRPSIDGVKVSEDDYNKYTMGANGNVLKDMRELFQTEAYQNATDDQKRKMIESYQGLQKYMGHEAIDPEYKMKEEGTESRIYKEEGIPALSEYYLEKYQNAETKDALKEGNYSTSDTAIKIHNERNDPALDEAYTYLTSGGKKPKVGAAVKTLNSKYANMSDDDKGYLLANSITSYTDKSKELYEAGNYADFYLYYSIREAVGGSNNKIDKGEKDKLVSYLRRNGLSNRESTILSWYY